MTYPVFDTNSTTGSIESATGPVTCASCGCRLTQATDGRTGWVHFSPMGGRDARGCRVACADAAHDDAGHTAA